mgnify:CR=1 FL=1
MNNSPEPLEGAPLIAPSSTDHPLYDQVVEACRSVYDPEIPVNIFDLGLIYTIDIDGENAVNITMTLTAPGCPVAAGSPRQSSRLPASSKSMSTLYGNRPGAWI